MKQNNDEIKKRIVELLNEDMYGENSRELVVKGFLDLFTEIVEGELRGLEEKLFYCFMDCPSDTKYTKAEIKETLSVQLKQYLIERGLS